MKVLRGLVVLCLLLGVSAGSQIIGQPVQIVDVKNNMYLLNEAALSNLLQREDVKDLPVVVVSISGIFRSGKSFILNFFLRYLTAPDDTRNESGEWLQLENSTSAGFKWRGGANRHTMGIWMWSEPFITTLPSQEKVAVLLMDTQGTFDSSSTVKDSTTIFGISLLISSTQIYNIKDNVKEDDLQHLQLFTEYAKSIQTDNGTKAFQVLKFLVRDWQYDYDFAYGEEGGAELLAERLNVTETMPRELRELRLRVLSCFERLECFLMPHPGPQVRQRNFTGRLDELSDEFKDSLMEFVPSIFGTNNLTPKLMDGEKVKSRDLFTYFKTYVEVFNSDKVPDVDSIIKATSRAALLAAVNNARDLYEIHMNRISDAALSVPTQALESEHRQALAMAVAAFRSKRTMASKAESVAYLRQMSEELGTRLRHFELINESKLGKTLIYAKKIYDTAIRNVTGSDLLCLHPQDLDEVHEGAVAAALTVFDTQRKRYPNVTDIARIKFKNEALANSLTRLRDVNEKHNRLAADSAQLAFASKMESLLSKEPPLDEEPFSKEYEDAKAMAVSKFESHRNKPSQHKNDPYKISLLEEMASHYIRLGKINRSKHRRALEGALNHYNTYMKNFWNPDENCLHPEDLHQAHERASRGAFNIFHPVEGDIETNLLSEIFESKYNTLKSKNYFLNRDAVSKAMDKYYGHMDENTSSNWWWLLVVPKLIERNNMPAYHEEAKAKAMSEFYSHRRDTFNTASDPFLDDLESKITTASQKYLW